MTKQIILLDRAIIEIKGVDRKSFLQGLITNDINKANKGDTFEKFNNNIPI